MGGESKQMKQINAQMDQYRQLTSVATDQLAQEKAKQDVDQKSIEEKQIRSERSRLGGAFMGAPQVNPNPAPPPWDPYAGMSPMAKMGIKARQAQSAQAQSFFDSFK